MSDNSFEVAAGNGRLYKLDQEKANAEQERLRGLREDKGHKWATADSAHSYDGFLQISQEYINWLQLENQTFIYKLLGIHQLVATGTSKSFGSEVGLKPSGNTSTGSNSQF